MRRRHNGADDGVPIHYSLAEIQVRGTNCLHRTNEHENVNIDMKKESSMKASSVGTTY